METGPLVPVALRPSKFERRVNESQPSQLNEDMCDSGVARIFGLAMLHELLETPTASVWTRLAGAAQGGIKDSVLRIGAPPKP